MRVRLQVHHRWWIPAMLKLILSRQEHNLEEQSWIAFVPRWLAWRLNIPGSCFSKAHKMRNDRLDSVSPHEQTCLPLSRTPSPRLRPRLTPTIPHRYTQDIKDNSAPDVNEKNEVIAPEATQQQDGQNEDAKPAQDVENEVAKSAENVVDKPEKNEDIMKPEENDIATDTPAVISENVVDKPEEKDDADAKPEEKEDAKPEENVNASKPEAMETDEAEKVEENSAAAEPAQPAVSTKQVMKAGCSQSSRA